MLFNKNEALSKTRVLKAFNHEIPDRVPINYLYNPGIHERLLKYYGLKPKDEDVLNDILGVDFRSVWVPYKGPRLHEEIPGINVNPEWGIQTKWVEHADGGYWDYCGFPLSNASEEEIELWPMPSPDEYDYSIIKDLCDKYANYALYTGNPGLVDIINMTSTLRGMEQTLVDLATDDPAGLRLIDRRLDIQLEVAERTLHYAKGKIDFLWIGEDLGTQHAPMISMNLFKEHIKPRHQRFIDLAKSYNIPVMIHSCGSSSWAFEEFIEMGINAVDTLQPEAKDMSPEFLKKKFGDRLTFHGCISTAGPVAYGTVEQVKENVKDTLEIMMPGGGYCLAPTHALQDNSPTENVVAMYETAQKLGKY